MIAHVLFDEAVAVVAADDRIGQMQVLDFGLQLAAIELAAFGKDFVGRMTRRYGPQILEEPV